MVPESPLRSGTVVAGSNEIERTESDMTALQSSNHSDVPASNQQRRSSVLDRPYLNISGRRHIPRLKNANRLPILMIGKPQSPTLSGIIRSKTANRLKWMRNSAAAKENKSFCEDEDQWDRLLATDFGEDFRIERSEDKWIDAIETGLKSMDAKAAKEVKKSRAVAAKMARIVEEETKLALEEQRVEKEEKARRKTERREVWEARERERTSEGEAGQIIASGSA